MQSSSHSSAAIFKTSILHLVLLSWLFPMLIFHAPNYCHAFSNTNNKNIPADTVPGAWKTRPLVPELAKTPASSQDNNQVTRKNTNSDTVGKSRPKREKWDFFRFLSQSSKFVTLPKPPLIPQRSVQVLPGDVLWQSATNAKEQATSPVVPRFTFAPLDDVVMGGVSSSSFSPIDGTWKGIVSDSNSGGFVGIRSTPFSNAIDMSKCKGVEMTLRGSKDKIFKAVIRDSTDFNGICWTTTFGRGDSNNKDWMAMIAKQTNFGQENVGKAEKGGIYKVKISFDDLIPTIFARTVPGQKLNPSTIQGFQIAYSKFLFDGELNPKFQLGDFQLDLLEIRAY